MQDNHPDSASIDSSEKSNPAAELESGKGEIDESIAALTKSGDQSQDSADNKPSRPAFDNNLREGLSRTTNDLIQQHQQERISAETVERRMLAVEVTGSALVFLNNITKNNPQ